MMFQRSHAIVRGSTCFSVFIPILRVFSPMLDPDPPWLALIGTFVAGARFHPTRDICAPVLMARGVSRHLRIIG